MQAFKKINFIKSYFETSTKVIKSQKGVSLTEVVAASAVASVVAIGSASLIAETKSIANQGEFQINIDSRQNLNVQKAKNIGLVLDRIASDISAAYTVSPIPGITVNTNAEDANFGKVSIANNCFKGNGTTCSDFNRTAAWYNLPNMYAGDTINGLTADRLISVSFQYKVFCNVDRCDKISLLITTRPSTEADCGNCNASAQARRFVAKDRISELSIPVSFFADKKDIDYTCADTNGRILTRLNYKNLVTTCDAYPAGADCAGDIPMTGYGGAAATCYTAVTGNCAQGIGNINPTTRLCN